MSKNSTDPRAAALRAAGHAEAAALLEKLGGSVHEPAPELVPEWQRQAQQERAAGQAMLDDMRRQLPSRFPAPAETEGEEA
jgi:hypothetical protein